MFGALMLDQGRGLVTGVGRSFVASWKTRNKTWNILQPFYSNRKVISSLGHLMLTKSHRMLIGSNITQKLFKPSIAEILQKENNIN